MITFILNRAPAVTFKINGVEHSERIGRIDVGTIIGDPDEVEQAARQSVVKSGTHSDGSPVDAVDLEGLDVSSAIRAAYAAARERARQKAEEMLAGEGNR